MCLFYSLYHFLSLAVNHCHLLSLIAICCHLLYQLLWLPFIVICCHSLSFIVARCTTPCHSLLLVVPLVVTRSTTCCHSLSFVVIRCHSLSLDVPLVCLFMNDVSTTHPAFAHFTYVFFFYLLAGTVTDHVKYQKRKLLQQQKPVNQDLFYPLAVRMSNNGLFGKTNALFPTKISKSTCNLGRV